MELLEESLDQLTRFLDDLTPFLESPEKCATSVLMEEAESLAWAPGAAKSIRATPILQKLSAVNAFIQLFISMCRSSQGIYNVSVGLYVCACVCVCRECTGIIMENILVS